MSRYLTKAMGLMCYPVHGSWTCHGTDSIMYWTLDLNQHNQELFINSLYSEKRLKLLPSRLLYSSVDVPRINQMVISP